MTTTTWGARAGWGVFAGNINQHTCLCCHLSRVLQLHCMYVSVYASPVANFKNAQVILLAYDKEAGFSANSQQPTVCLTDSSKRGRVPLNSFLPISLSKLLAFMQRIPAQQYIEKNRIIACSMPSCFSRVSHGCHFLQ